MSKSICVYREKMGGVQKPYVFVSFFSNPPPPRAQQPSPKPWGVRGPLLFRSIGPPIRMVKHTLYGPDPPILRKTHTLWPVPPNPRGIAHTFTPIPSQYGQRCSPDSHNMALIQPKIAQHDPKWPQDRPKMASYGPKTDQHDPRWPQ
jgi:hypothetical protein